MIAVIAGDYGKPRPAVVVQTDEMLVYDSVVVCPLTSGSQGASVRLQLEPSSQTGVKVPSEVMVEKISAVARRRVRSIIGRLSAEDMRALDERLTFLLGLAGGASVE